MALPFSFVSQESVPPPAPALNGGLYTGEPFAPGAPWANVPVIMDAGYLTNMNLRSANPPAAALVQYPGNNRPGNNHQTMPGVVVVSDLHGLLGSSPASLPDPRPPRFAAHAYLNDM